ncbi:MAG: alpha/beta hydrolase [Clostridia bacterium]|nr:alpha/beta hydrolase [Clostridia bacterium]
MIEKFKAALPRALSRKPRTVYVYVPDEFEDEPDARYPVLYMFDGHNVFFDEDATYGKCWGMKEFMEETGIPMIVVAVDCNHSPRHGRLREYSPFDFEFGDVGFIRGKGRTTMNWFTKTLKPLIDGRYPTLPGREHTFIAGSSMGGLMSLYAILAHNDVYSRACCLSPSIWVAPEKVSDLIDKAKLAPDTVIYMDYGSREMANHEGIRPIFAATTAQLIGRNVWVSSRIVPNGDHCEACWEEQLPFLFDHLLYTRE